MTTRAGLIEKIQAERADWRALLAEIGEERMEEPGPMGAWTFKDLAAHLTFWGDRTIARLEAGPGGKLPPDPWPASMGTEDEIEDWDEVNAWIYKQLCDRPLRDVLADMDQSFERLAQVIETMPEDDLMTPGRFGWDGPIVEATFFGHYHEEHEAAVRDWLRTR